MRKILKYSACLSLILSYYAMYFIALPFLGLIIEPRIFTGSIGIGIQYALTEFLLFSIQILLISYLLNICIYPKNRIGMKPLLTFKRSFFPLLGLKLLCDLFNLFINWLLSWYSDPIRLFNEGLLILISFYLIKRKIGEKSAPWAPVKKHLSIMFVFAGMLTFAGYLLFFLKQLNVISIENSKTASTELYFFALLWLCLIWAILLIVFGFWNHFEYIKEKPLSKFLATGVARFMLGGFLPIFILAVKFFTFPAGMISNIEAPSLNSTTFSDEKTFGADFVTKQVYRYSTYNLETVAYRSTKIFIKYRNDILMTYQLDAEIDGKILEILTKINVDGIEAWRFKTEVLAFIDNGNAVVLLSKDINRHMESKPLTQILESLIIQGHSDFIEHSSEYLMKYDRDFIAPYLERHIQEN